MLSNRAIRWTIGFWLLCPLFGLAKRSLEPDLFSMKLAGSSMSTALREVEDEKSLQLFLEKLLKDKNSELGTLLRSKGVKSIEHQKNCLEKRYVDDGTEYVLKHGDGYWSKSYLDPVLGGQMRDEQLKMKIIVNFSESGVLSYCVPKVTRHFRRETYALKPGLEKEETILSEWSSSHEAGKTKELLHRWIESGNATLVNVDTKAVESLSVEVPANFAFLGNYFTQEAVNRETKQTH